MKKKKKIGTQRPIEELILSCKLKAAAELFISQTLWWNFSSFWLLMLKLVLCFKAFRWHLSVESLSVFAVVVDHVVISDPLHLTLLSIAQLVVGWGSPPVGGCLGPALASTNWPVPLASPCPEIAVPRCEWRTVPVDLDAATLCRPVIGIP